MNQQGGIAGSKHTGTARDVATVLVASYARSHAMPAVRLSSARALVRECLDFAATSAKACPARSAERMSRGSCVSMLPGEAVQCHRAPGGSKSCGGWSTSQRSSTER